MPVFRTLLALFACASLVLADHEVHTLTGKTIKGKVLAITAKEVVQKGDAGLVKTPLAQVLSIDLRPGGKGNPETPHTLVRLVDDSLLRCRKVEIKGKQVELTLLSGQTGKLPLSAIAWLLKEAEDAKVHAQWKKIVAAPVKRDRIVVLRDGELNPLQGTLGEADAQGKTIPFRPEAGAPVQLRLERLHGLIFYRTESPTEAAVCLVYDTEGDVLAASKVAISDGTFQLTTPAGLKVDLAEKVLARLDYNRGKLTYLSDMEPTKVVERSGAGLLVRYQRDKNLDQQQPIVLINKGASTEYSKGLSMHAYTELEYDLGGKYKDFKAVLGVDPRTGSDSHALVTIECDGVKKFSETVSADVTRTISLNVRDVRLLRIIVSSQNFLDLHDHATLAEARVSQ